MIGGKKCYLIFMLRKVEELHYFVIYYTKYTLATTVTPQNKTKSPFAAIQLV